MRTTTIRHINATRRFTSLALMGVSGTAAALLTVGMPLVAAYLIAINLVTFFLYGYDKGVAGTGSTRVPERVLFVMALAGGAAAALIAQQSFRHKTRKGDVVLLTYLALALHAGIALYAASRLF